AETIDLEPLESMSSLLS
nr:hypothetical protein [Tanacetum cinerariifolium]